jgi:flagellar biosynthesis chaperone FliJ
MTRFHFPLQRVLDWRRTELEIEEAKFRQGLTTLAAIHHARVELEAGAVRMECEVRRWDPVDGADLAALGRRRARVRWEEARLAAKRSECAKAVEAQQTTMLEARRKLRLLERLKERRLAEWKAANDREVEEIASESYLASWGRSRRPAL